MQNIENVFEEAQEAHGKSFCGAKQKKGTRRNYNLDLYLDYQSTVSTKLRGHVFPYIPGIYHVKSKNSYKIWLYVLKSVF